MLNFEINIICHPNLYYLRKEIPFEKKRTDNCNYNTSVATLCIGPNIQVHAHVIL